MVSSAVHAIRGRTLTYFPQNRNNMSMISSKPNLCKDEQKTKSHTTPDSFPQLLIHLRNRTYLVLVKERGGTGIEGKHIVADGGRKAGSW